MKTNLKQSFLNTIMGPLGALILFIAPHAFAFPTSGTCAMLVSQPVPYGQTLPATNGLNILATITFTGATTGTLSYNSVRAVYSSSGPVAGTPDLFNNIAFTLAAGPIAGSKQLTSTGGGLVVNMYAVNGDKTVLVQGQNHLSQGVCQF